MRSTGPNSAVDRARTTGAGDVADIYSIPDQLTVHKARPQLRPEEELVSLPPPREPDSQIEALNRFLGPRLTVDNPVWRGDPVMSLRSLQKLLIEHSLALPENERPECLAALSLVERAVQLRLRWNQMQRSDAESNDGQEGERKDEDQDKAAGDGQ